MNGGSMAAPLLGPAAAAPQQQQQVRREGWLIKVARLGRSRRRWFRIQQDVHGAWVMHYFASQRSIRALGALRLCGAEVHLGGPAGLCGARGAQFTLRGPLFDKTGKVYRFRCASDSECAAWVDDLTIVCRAVDAQMCTIGALPSQAGPQAAPQAWPQAAPQAAPRSRAPTLSGCVRGGASAVAHGALGLDPVAATFSEMPAALSPSATETRQRTLSAICSAGLEGRFPVTYQQRAATLRVNAATREVVLSALQGEEIASWKAITGFSYKKCVDQKRSLELVLRGRALIADGALRRLHFKTEHTVGFRSLADREACVSLCAMVLNDDGRAQPLEAAPLTHPLRLFLGTWNLGERAPPGDLHEWLGAAEQCNMAVVAAQESNYRARDGHGSTDDDFFGSVLKNLNRTTPREEWFATVDTITVYDPLTSREMRLGVFVKERDAWRVGDLQTTSEGTGVAHVGQNKGGLCVAMRYMATPICFVAAHLAAHQGALSRRASDISEIIEGVSQAVGTKGVDVTHEYSVFWLGDLNYRIDTQEDSKEFMSEDPSWYSTIQLRDKAQVLRLVQERNWGPLWEDDQLRKAMRRCRRQVQNHPRLFPGFFEAGDPAFPPTFKVVPAHKMVQGEDYLYDPKRTPSWCDRVLYSSLASCPSAPSSVTTQKYFSAPGLQTSDHKPVGCVLEVSARHEWPGHWPPNKDCRIVVQLFSLRADNVRVADLTGTSDPYLQVRAPFAIKPVRSSTVKRNLSPVWKDIITLTGEIGDLVWLEGEHLTLSVLDWDLSSADDELGQVVLCLRGCCDAQAHSFDLDIVQYGRLQGRLQGEFCCGVVPPGERMPKAGTSSPRVDLVGLRASI